MFTLLVKIVLGISLLFVSLSFAEPFYEQEYTNAKVTIEIWPIKNTWWNIANMPLYVITCFVGTRTDGAVETIILKSIPLEFYIWSITTGTTTTTMKNYARDN